MVLRRAVSGCDIVVADAQGRHLYSHETGQVAALSQAKESKQLRIASISKTMTSVVAARYLDAVKGGPEGYSLNTTLQDLAASDPALLDRLSPYNTLIDFMDRLTLQDLLSHRGGFRHYQTLEEYLYNGSEPLDMFGNDPLEADPGEQYYYSSFGFQVRLALYIYYTHTYIYVLLVVCW